MEVDLPKEYDVIVVGTGLVECIVAAASARIGKKVLHIDKNDYYGGQWASFTLQGMDQWIKDMSLQEQSEASEADTCELKEGETTLETCDPRRVYSEVKHRWHIDKCSVVEEPSIEESAAPSTSEDEKPNNGEDGSAQNTSEDAKVEGSGESETSNAEKQEQSTNSLVETKPTESAAPSTSEDEKPNDGEESSAQNTSEDAKVEGSGESKTSTAEKQEQSTNSLVETKPTERQSWSQENMMKLTRKFNLDLAPKLLYSRGSLVELLISSNVARYAEFKCITRVLTWLSSGEEEGKLVVVPCSRSDVFTTDSVSLVEKRLLMKLLEFCHNYDQHPEQIEEFEDKTFIDFLKARRQTPNLIHFVTESIAMVDGNVSCCEGLERTKLFLTSLGRYGTTPFLFSMYGCGELPQAFCRLCAVFEGTYVLRRPVSSIILNESNSCVGLVSNGERFTCSHLVMDAFYAPDCYLSSHQDSSVKSISRGIFIIDRSIFQNEKEQLSLLRLPAKGANKKPVTILEVGFGSGVCPKELYCVHMTCQGCDAEEDLKVAVERLFASEGEDADKPKLLWSLYYNQTDKSDIDLTGGIPENINLCSGPDANLNYDSAISQARSVFVKMFPDEEFLPRAPDPDEIVFDNAGAEPKQGDNFSSDDTAGKEGPKDESNSSEESTEKVELNSENNSDGSTDVSSTEKTNDSLNVEQQESGKIEVDPSVDKEEAVIDTL